MLSRRRAQIYKQLGMLVLWEVGRIHVQMQAWMGQ